MNLKIAEENHLNAVAEGSNMDDNRDYRPGLAAVRELGIKSPLRAFLPDLLMERQSMKKSWAW